MGGIQEFLESFRCNICRRDWSILYYQSKETDSNNVSKSILQTEKTLGSTGNDRTICPRERKRTAYLGFRTSIFFSLPMGIRFFILPALTLSVQSENIINHSQWWKCPGTDKGRFFLKNDCFINDFEFRFHFFFVFFKSKLFSGKDF